MNEEQKHDAKMDVANKPKGRPQPRPEDLVKLVRILAKDIRGNLNLYRGLGSIKGISWSFANAVCTTLKLDKTKKIQDLSEQEIKQIENFIQNPEGLPSFLFNRRMDRDDGTDKHVYGADLGLQTEFDIKRLKKIKSFKGVRHQLGQPVRGQRTKSHFRRNKKKSGGGTVTAKPVAKPKAAEATKGDKKK